MWEAVQFCMWVIVLHSFTLFYHSAVPKFRHTVSHLHSWDNSDAAFNVVG